MSGTSSLTSAVKSAHFNRSLHVLKYAFVEANFILLKKRTMVTHPRRHFNPSFVISACRPNWVVLPFRHRKGPDPLPEGLGLFFCFVLNVGWGRNTNIKWFRKWHNFIFPCLTYHGRFIAYTASIPRKIAWELPYSGQRQKKRVTN